MMLKLPVIGQICTTPRSPALPAPWPFTFKAGVPLVEALETVAGATGNIIYAQGRLWMKEDVAVGYRWPPR
jgi:type IV pilus assembly protein PilC